MPRTRREEAPVGVDAPELEGRYVDLDGYTVGFETYHSDLDPAPLFAGLPDDRCQCPHWGVVRRGQIVFRYADREEIFTAGDAYYAPPGHTPVIFADTEVVEFSPTADLERTMAVVEANMQATSPA